MALTLRTDSELEKALDALVASEGLSRQEVIRRAVLDYADRRDLDVVIADSSRRNIDKWGDVLDRLGSV